MHAPAPTTKVCPACNSRYGTDVAFCSRDGTPLIADLDAMKTDLVGQVLVERYRIVRLLGEGGMGQVYEAQHVNINKKFAIKLLRPEITSNAEAVARFRQEAWSASSIGHENIIEIDDFATLPSGAVYLAMEFLQGCSLADRMLAEPSMALDETLAVMLQVCRGLDAAHDKGIIHRDMKPENVFLAEKSGRVVAKILDFGIAKVSGAESSQALTRTGAIFGTPHYMSPEQALGRSLDHRADIYSVGVMMYEAFTGRVPFEAESFMGILTKHITVEPTPPREMSPHREILPEVEAVILRAMAKEVTDRYQSMHELVVALEGIAATHAPDALRHQSGSISAAIAVGAGSGSLAAQPARGSTPSAIRPVRAAPISSSQAEAEAVPRNRTGRYAALVIALVVLGGAAFVLTRPKPPQVVATTTSITPPPAATAPDVTILVDSVPPSAEILRDSEHIGDTPWNVTLKGGKPETVVIRKPGYVTQPVLLRDAPAFRHNGELRNIVTLEREPVAKPTVVARPSTKEKVNTPAPPPVVPPPLVTSPPPRAGSQPRYVQPVSRPPQQESDLMTPWVDKKRSRQIP